MADYFLLDKTVPSKIEKKGKFFNDIYVILDIKSIFELLNIINLITS